MNSFEENRVFNFFLGTRTYIDGTKDLNTMKQRLRFRLPHTPLRVLRGEEEVEDIQDRYFERFVPPTSSDDTTDYRSDATEHVTTDIDDVSDEGMARYLGGSIDDFNRDSRSASNRSSIRGVSDDSDSDNQMRNHENIEMQVFRQENVEPEEIDDMSV